MKRGSCFKKVGNRVSINLLGCSAGVDVGPHSDDGASSATIGASESWSWSCSCHSVVVVVLLGILPAGRVEHVAARKPQYLLTVFKCFLTDGAALVHAFVDNRHDFLFSF